MPNSECNVPGCTEPLGAYGVWCPDCYRTLYAADVGEASDAE